MQPILATRAHIRALMSWFPDERSVRVWGGPFFRFPFDEDTFLQDLHWGRMATHVLVDADGTLLAFGQWYEKEGRIHLARLAVSPTHRGTGIGRVLIERLTEQGREVFPGADNSLYVIRTNERAVRCYRGLGFEEALPPATDKLPPDQMFMVRRAAS
jgi:ribosomal protein S18 acetylase RimI-like enzyme